MLLIETMADGTTIVKFKKDWHPSSIGKAYVGEKYRNHTSAGLEFQKVVLSGKLRAAYERVGKGYNK
jgi:hypothetical protein